MTDPSAMDLFGTDQPPPARRVLCAGPLTAVLEDGALRSIRHGGTEVIRGIAYLARDTAWGTHAPTIGNLRVEDDVDGFRVSYDAVCDGPDGRFDWRMTIHGTATRLALRAEGRAMSDFATNRTGFVVLHPADCAGSALSVRHADGTTTATRFPDAIAPDNPVTGIAAMTHHPAPGLTATLVLNGDAFEMEDQRNWADASFKTFVRPLSKPRPYVIPGGTVDIQSVVLTVTGMAPAATGTRDAALQLGGTIGTMPRIGLFADRPRALAGDAASLGQGIAQHLTLRWRPGTPTDALRAGAAFAGAIGAAVMIEALLPARDPTSEVRALLDTLALAGIAPAAIHLAPLRELSTRPSRTLPPGEVPVDTLVEALRRTGFAGVIGAGTPSFFTEFNRNPPGPAADVVVFGGCGIVHAADDASVAEAVGVYPAILASAARLAPGRPIHLGPCTLGARHTPYADRVAANPRRRRVTMAEDDPRHAALFGAAWAVAMVAATAGHPVAAVTLASPFGPFGLVDPAGRQFPLHAVHRILAGAAGCPRIAVQGGPAGLAALVWNKDGALRMLLGNLSPDPIAVPLPDGAGDAAMIAADAGMEPLARPGGRLTLPPWRCAGLTVA